MREETTHWEAQQGPQRALLACEIEDIGYGGARGGGKTAGMLGDFVSHVDQYGRFARGIFFRRTYPELEEVARQADILLVGMGWKKSGGVRPMYIAPCGATLKLRALQRDGDADKYQGHSYTWIGFDESTNWPSPGPLDKIRACLRASEGRIQKKIIWTANPGGVGHNWFKARYIDAAPPYKPHYCEEQLTWRVFIPSTLDNNPALVANDPDYWKRVVASANGNQELIRAWRYGDWDIVAGGMFDDKWKRNIHVVKPFPIPHSWRIDRSFDWGSSKPFSVGFWAESDGTQPQAGDGTKLLPRTYPRGTVFRIGEIYGWQKGKPNEGLKMLARDIAKQIIAYEKERGWRWGTKPEESRCKPGPADSSIYDAENGVSIANDMAKEGIKWTAADKSPGSRIAGAEKVRSYLQASMQFPMESPGLFVFENCQDGFIRTVPVLPRDKDNMDDVDSDAEDHSYDETRYRLSTVRREIRTERLGGL